jgi:hypothetical protein
MKEGGRVFQDEHLHPSFKTSLRVAVFYKKFLSQFGTVDCVDILTKAPPSKNKDFCKEIAQQTAQLALDLIDV